MVGVLVGGSVVGASVEVAVGAGKTPPHADRRKETPINKPGNFLMLLV
jgi:hypothetical protein